MQSRLLVKKPPQPWLGRLPCICGTTSAYGGNSHFTTGRATAGDNGGGDTDAQAQYRPTPTTNPLSHNGTTPPPRVGVEAISWASQRS